ncbi:hypothetical protein [Paucihalobacter sp.]|uniref:hypothetical protein n=1 Tax=Paucihalobacter sp. TaxID=2850405 RepID=UPI002FE2EDF5
MDIIDNIINYLKDENKQKAEPSPGDTCPNCWGHQQYDGKIRQLLKDRQIDINNHKDSYMVIQAFLKENIDGFKLKEGDVQECPTCVRKNSKALKND